MSIQLQGTGLVIKGKTIVTPSGDLFANNFSAQTIDIKHGGLKVKGSSTISGDLVVQGNIIGDCISSTCNTILNKYSSYLVEILAKVNTDTYISQIAAFVSDDGWVVTQGRGCIGDTSEVWGTIRMVSKEKNIDVIKADGIFMDHFTGLCFIKFPDIKDHDYFKWVDNKDVNIGDPCFILSSAVYPMTQSTINISTIQYTNFKNCNANCVLTALVGAAPKPGSIVLNYRGELVCILQIGYEGLYGGVDSDFAKHSMMKIMDTMDDVDLTMIPSLGIVKSSDVTHLEIVLSGLLGLYKPQGIIIDNLSESSSLTKANPAILCGNIITHIDNVEISSISNINGILLGKNPGESISVRFISPPNIDERLSKVILQSMTEEELMAMCIAQELEATYITKYPYIADYEQTNADHAQEIYEATHQDEIKYKKKMYLLDRLKNVKSRKRVKSRVKSRKR